MTFPEDSYSVPVIYIKFYKKLMKAKKVAIKYHLTLKQYRDIIYLFNKKLAQALLKGAICELPYGIGEMRIKKKFSDARTARPNMGEFMKTGIKSIYLNEHSDRFRARFYWNKQNCDIRGSYMFAFEPMTGNKRELAKVMKTEGGHKNFLE